MLKHELLEARSDVKAEIMAHAELFQHFDALRTRDAFEAAPGFTFWQPRFVAPLFHVIHVPQLLLDRPGILVERDENLWSRIIKHGLIVLSKSCT